MIRTGPTILCIALVSLVGSRPASAVSPCLINDPTRVPTSCLCDGDFVISGEALGHMDIVDDEIETYMRAQEIPNASVAITDRRGRLVLARGYTNCDAFPEGEEKFLAQPTSQYRVASVSKTLTSIAIHKLIEDGRLLYGDKLLEFIDASSIDSSSPADTALSDVNVHHLLTHRGGWSEDFNPFKQDAEIAEAVGECLPIEPEDIIKFMNGRMLDANPGAVAAYSGYGYLLLGEIIEAVTGQSYEYWVRDNVLMPVDACDTVVGTTAEDGRLSEEVRYYPHPWNEENLSEDAECSGSGVAWPARLSVLDSNLVDGDLLADRECVPYPYGKYNYENMAAAGGWLSTAVDLVTVAQDLTKYSISQGNNDLLNAATIFRMFTKVSTVDGLDYGRGWYLNHYRAGDRGHGGTLNGHKSVLYIFPTSNTNWKLNDVTLALLFNREPADDVDSAGDGEETAEDDAGDTGAEHDDDQPPSYSLSDLMEALVEEGGVLGTLTDEGWGVGEEDLFSSVDHDACAMHEVP